MHVTVVGSGYVGLVAGACLAETGNNVICVDVDAAKIERLKRNEIPIYEPGLEPMVRRNQEGGRIEQLAGEARDGRSHPVVQRREAVLLHPVDERAD